MKVKTKGLKKKFMHVMGGTVLTEDVFLKNTHFIIVIIVIVVLYIGNRYSCIEKVAKIDRLQRELKDVKYESLTISAELMGVNRESHVRDMVDKKGLQLERTKEPVYKIKD